MTILFYALIASVLALAWWLFPHADEAQIRMVLKSDDVGQDWARSLKDHPITLLPAIPGHQHKLGSDGWPVCGCSYQFPQDAERVERLRKVMQAQERKR